MSNSEEVFEKQEYDGKEDKLYCLKHAMNNLFNHEHTENKGKGWLEVNEFIQASEHLNEQFPTRKVRHRNWGTDEAFRLVNHKDFRLFDDDELPELMRLIEVPHNIYYKKSEKDMSTFFNKMFQELKDKYMGVNGVHKFIKGFLVHQNWNHWVCYRLNYESGKPYRYLYKDSLKKGPISMTETELKKVFLDIAMTNRKLPKGTPFINIMVLFNYQFFKKEEYDKRNSHLFPMETFENIKNSTNTSSTGKFRCVLCEYLGHTLYHNSKSHYSESHPHTLQCMNAFQQFLQSGNN